MDDHEQGEFCSHLRWARIELGAAIMQASFSGDGRRNARTVRNHLRNARGMLVAAISAPPDVWMHDAVRRVAWDVDRLIAIAGARRQHWRDRVAVGARAATGTLFALAVNAGCSWALAQKEAGLVSATVERHKEVA